MVASSGFSAKLYESFECTMCGKCCKGGWNVWLEAEAFHRIWALIERDQDELGLEPGDVLALAEQPYHGHFGRLVPRDNGDCPFLDKENLCALHGRYGHEVLGWVCQAFPRGGFRELDATYVVCSMACPPMADILVAWPDPIKLEASSATLHHFPSQFPDFVLAHQEQVRVRGSLWTEASAVGPLREAILDLLQTEGVPLPELLLMGRLFLEQLVDDVPRFHHLTAKTVRAGYSALEADGTSLYVEALRWPGDALVLSHFLYGIFKSRGAIGMPTERAKSFMAMVEALGLKDGGAASLGGLYRARIAPCEPWLNPILARYAAHRWLRGQLIRAGGLLAWYHDVLLSVLLVQCYLMARPEPLTQATVAEVICEVEEVFFHVIGFYRFWAEGDGTAQTLTPAFAAVLVKSLRETEVPRREDRGADLAET